MNKGFAYIALCFTVLALILAAFSGFAYAECVEQGIETPSDATLTAPEDDPAEEVVEQYSGGKQVTLEFRETNFATYSDSTSCKFTYNITIGDASYNHNYDKNKQGYFSITKIIADYTKITITQNASQNQGIWATPVLECSNNTINITQDANNKWSFTMPDNIKDNTIRFTFYNTKLYPVTFNKVVVPSSESSLPKSYEFEVKQKDDENWTKITLDRVEQTYIYTSSQNFAYDSTLYVRELADSNAVTTFQVGSGTPTTLETDDGYKTGSFEIEGDTTVTLIDKYAKDVNFSVSPKVEYAPSDLDDDTQYTFYIKLSSGGNDVKPSAKIGDDPVVFGNVIDDNASYTGYWSFKLTKGQTANFVSTIKATDTLSATIAEAPNNNYRTSYTLTNTTGSTSPTYGNSVTLEDVELYTSITFTNTYKTTPQPVETYDVTVTKMVSGDGDKSRYFSFEYTITNPDDSISSGKFELCDGESKKIISLQENASIVVREIPVTDYTTTYTVSGDATEHTTTDGATESMAIIDGMEIVFTGTYTPAETPTAEPTQAPTAEPTEQPTQEPTATSTAEPTQEPTAAPTTTPTATPTVTPTSAPTAAPAQGTAIVTTSGSRLRLRVKPSTASAVVTSMPNGATVTVLETRNSWSYIHYAVNGKTYEGWAASEYLTAQGDIPKPTAAPTAAPTTVPTTKPTAEPTTGDTAIATVTTSGSMLRMRAAASTSSKIITKITNGTDIVVLKFGSDWSLCRYNGYTGYCSNDYLTFG